MQVCFGNLTFSFSKVEAKGFPQHFVPLGLGCGGLSGGLGGGAGREPGQVGPVGVPGRVKSHGHLFCLQDSA